VSALRIVLRAENLPGRRFVSDGQQLENVHVGLQIRKDAVELVPADANLAEWVVDIDVVDQDGVPDFRGPAVQGKRGERFIYLTWGEVSGGTFAMFRRAKLMLADVPGVASGEASTQTATVNLTDERGGPRCARLRPPALRWS
jgi:hypothetical protein